MTYLYPGHVLLSILLPLIIAALVVVAPEQ